MSERRPESQQSASLRERAEKVFREMLDSSLENLDALSPETLRASLHELRVHQIELEMQNEDLRRAQADLDALRARYFDLYELAPVGYCTVSEKGLILEANLTAATLLRRERDALVGTRLSGFISKECQEFYYLCRKNLLDAGQPQECDLQMVRSDGTAFFAHLNFTAAREEKDAPVCRVALIDVTAHKRVEDNLAAALEFHKQLLENAPALIWRAGTDAKCDWFNTTWLEFTGRTMEQELGDGWAEGVHAEDFDRCLKLYLDAFAARRPFHMDYRLRRPDGTYSWISDFGIPLTNGLSGDFCGYIGYCFDIMELKSMEERLKESLVAANAANRAKSEFLGVMSHELRTPLNGVLGFAQLLSDTSLNSEQKDYAETICKSGEHLLAIVSDILDFSSIDAGALAIHVAPLSVADLVKTAEDIVRKAAAEKGLELRCELAAGVPEQIAGDALRIRQILINLLGNAVKFTASGSVVLRVSTASAGGRHLDFCVEDTGIGISSETLGQLFQPFVQADSKMNRPFGGTGLGLAITKRLAEAMGGSITVASTPGKGSAFTFRFPLEPATVSLGGMAAVPSHPFIGADGASPSSRGADTPARPDGTHFPALVVDDDNASGVVAVKMLKNLGYHAEFVADGAEAVAAFAPDKYSVIFMDVAMPVMGGFVATKKIREIEMASGYHVPIIAFTANVMPGDRERCLAAGMNDFLAKPFKRDELAAKLACVSKGK
jgi:two-component system CheB/CheR fusion protein